MAPEDPQQKNPLVLYDSLSGSYKALPEKGLAWYTCGPTTYAPAHLGHARTYVCLDIVRRVLEYRGNNKAPPPLFVMNITDVDDKILAAADETGQAPLDLARQYEKDFWRDLDALGCLRPHIVTRVTEHVETDVVSYIERLIDNGMAYVASDGVYFDVRAYESKMGHVTKYGKLAPPSASSDFYSSHGPVDTKKQDSRDFSLWKLRKQGERLSWQSPWGEGRPGWHIECSAMIEAIQERFQDSHKFHVHAGGMDLKFPHHTNEIAQAEAFHFRKEATEEWIPHWVHTGHLHIHGMKMSKSLKNFITIQEMLSEGSASSEETSVLSSPADDFRLWCLGLSGSYRGPATYSKDRLNEAKVTREKLVRFLLEGERWIRDSDETAPKRWSDQDHELLTLVNEAASSCNRAMVGLGSEDDNTRDFDLDGSTFVEEMLRIVEAGNVRMSSCSVGSVPVEPVRAAVVTLRDLLSLVGFSDATVRIGLEHSNDRQRSHVVGGERGLIEELVRFRSAIRKAALSDIGDKAATDNVREILNLCDGIRKEVLPSMGLELLDEKVDDDSPAAAGWRFIVPKKVVLEHGSLDNSKKENKSTRHVRLLDVRVEDLFRTGQYEGMFSEFKDDGIPVLNADGSEVSKRLLKKLLKKREKHQTRLQNTASRK